MHSNYGHKLLQNDFNDKRGRVANNWQLIEENSIPLKSYTRRELRTEYVSRPPDVLRRVGQTEWAYTLIFYPILFLILLVNWILIGIIDWIEEHWTIAQSYNELIDEKPNPFVSDYNHCRCGPEYWNPMLAKCLPCIGRKISVISSRYQIRYEGLIRYVDIETSTLILSNVRICGTEDRPTRIWFGPQDCVFDFVQFRAQYWTHIEGEGNESIDDEIDIKEVILSDWVRAESTSVWRQEWAYNLLVFPIIVLTLVLNWILILVIDWIEEHWTIAQSYNDLIREKPNPIVRDADHCSCGPEYWNPMLAKCLPCVGRKISVIGSIYQIRYEGILTSVDIETSTLILSNVRICGTEDRPTRIWFGPQDCVSDFVQFKAQYWTHTEGEGNGSIDDPIDISEVIVNDRVRDQNNSIANRVRPPLNPLIEKCLPFVGHKISVISLANNRYEGVLTSIDTEFSTLTLTDVKFWGTEDRYHPVKSSPLDNIIIISTLFKPRINYPFNRSTV